MCMQEESTSRWREEWEFLLARGDMYASQNFPHPLAGLGFEDCSAPVTDLNATVPGEKNATVVSLEHQHVEPDKW